MFSEYRIHPALLHLLYCLLCSAGEEVVRLQELEGNTVTIHTGLTEAQSDAHILWFYGPENADIKIVNSLVFKGETNTDYPSERFRDRLQLNRTSGSLTIRNISREDSGLYKLHIITGSISGWSFSIDVYAPVSKPVIRNQTEKRSVSLRESCSPLCSVENGKDVSLSWYEEKERISSISSSDSSERLYLPLNKTNPDCSTYTCVAANPVSNQTTQLNITELCIKSGR
ncbi:CD48 antigen-like [Pygocentrus nattereri]|uniref:CD48 antigen-like n=1 Tax=Pygocentrus nattereri TaxID=42514 RepID=UPI0018916C8F|nr:CD48 antigen-like [Pygocentrus nattereri]